MSWTDPQTYISILAGIASLLAAYHALNANKKATTIKANVNGNLERLVQILAEAAITIPHETATRVVSAPPADVPVDASTDERLAMEWLQKVKNQ